MEKQLHKKKNLFIISGLWSGARDFFLEGDSVFSGMPAFSNVFLRLLESERVNKIYFFLLLPKEDVDKINIATKYKNKIELRGFSFNPKNKLISLLLFIKVIVNSYFICKKNKVNKIAGFGPLSGLTAIIGKLVRVPDSRRLYGTFLINEINLSPVRLFFKHPLEYLTLKLKGKCLLITNDGTKGDLVFKKFGNPKMPFYFPLNGVDLDIENKLEKPNFDLEKEYFVYVARVEEWKRQNFLVDALIKLNNKGIVIPKTYIVGRLIDKRFVKEMKGKIKLNNLESKIIFTGSVKSKVAHYFLKNSKLSFSLYHTSNLGNVFLEGLRMGVPFICINDTNSLDLISKESFIEVKKSCIDEVSEKIEMILKDNTVLKKYSKKAKEFSDVNISSWEKRAKMELDLILD